MERSAKDRHLDRSTDKKMTDFVEDVVKGLKGRDVDLIIPIASGGFEPGVLVADYLEVYNILPVRYYCTRSGGKIRDDRGPYFAAYAPKDHLEKLISGKNCLIVDDLATSTMSFSCSLNLVKSYSPKDIYFAVIDGCKAPGLYNCDSPTRHLKIVR